jgi:hypothetical protein
MHRRGRVGGGMCAELLLHERLGHEPTRSINRRGGTGHVATKL